MITSNSEQGSPTDKDRLFWISIRRAALEVVRAIEVRYGLESAVITNEQRKRLHRQETRPLDTTQNLR